MIEEHIPVQLSHLLRDCSVGAVVRGPDSLMVVQDTRTWDRPGADPLEREIRYVERVRSALGINDKLCAPPRAVERDGTVTGWIPALRFPTWMRCLRCGLMHSAPWRKRPSKSKNGSHPGMANSRVPGNCEGDGCDGRLEQTPWVLIHEEGYLADVPWHDLAHRDSRNPDQRQCRPDWSHPYLKLEDTGLDRRLRCDHCNSQTTFSTTMVTRTKFPSRAWQQPWIREPPVLPLNTEAWIVEINDVRVHYPETRTALVIPPESRIRQGTVTDRLYGSTRSQQSVQNARNPLARRTAVKRLADELRCTAGDIEQALRDINNGYPLYGRSITGTDLMIDEYRALTEKIPDLREEEDFVTEHHTHAWQEFGRTVDSNGIARRVIGAVSSLVAVNRLKEIMTLIGFRRAGGDKPTPPDITGKTGWLPAIELYGEGIFFTLDEDILRSWEDDKAIYTRADAFSKRYLKRTGPNYSGRDVEVSPRFMLCHTLSHLMIRELDTGAGYPAASLKERIYCATGDEPMAGILIYVAVPDEEGSLGGLMELAKPHRFLRLLTRAFESAAWCSLDPVCCEQEGHGPDQLNRAACHACVLVPETSCDHENILLDRVFVNGAGKDIPAFLEFAGPFDCKRLSKP